MNIISSVVAVAAIGLFCTDIGYYQYNYHSCYWEEYPNSCYFFADSVLVIRWTALAFLLVATLLQFCVSVSLSAFGCRALSHKDVIPPQVFVIPNTGINSPPLASENQNRNDIPQRNDFQVAETSTYSPQATGNPRLPNTDYNMENRSTPSLYPSYPSYNMRQN
ncbi:putative membrane-spanning 4-domains subfamily A member 4E [Bombina bombina]|uniref:putative membrane-spanning 4-domains subfamily A member 4E n=1 Tax=Bombina bombina TaxID=8345 RepID=UPI00235B2B8B|nr:putative membrane-spanning 4-domains subfamily A member 4E [Bombina bombina]